MDSIFNVEILEEIGEVSTKIHYLRDDAMITACPIKKQYLEKQLINEVDYMLVLIDELCKVGMSRQSVQFTVDELSNYDGKKGKPAYVAVNGIVYDVSNESTWGGGSHFGLIAGKDLTIQFNSCHGMKSILSNLPKVGVLK